MFYRGYRVTITKSRGRRSRRITITRDYDGIANWGVVVALMVIIWIAFK